MSLSAYWHMGHNNCKPAAEDQPVECSTTVNCSSNSTLMSARECCVNSVDGLSYSIPGQQQCHTCVGKYLNLLSDRAALHEVL